MYAYKTTEDNYLYKYEDGEFATDTWCGGTKELSLANDDLAQIAEVKRFYTFLSWATVPAAILTMIIALNLIVKKKNHKT